MTDGQVGGNIDGAEDAGEDKPGDHKAEPTYGMKVGSALFYSAASLAVIFVNKAIMTA